jgi:hypothetical protein
MLSPLSGLNIYTSSQQEEKSKFDSGENQEEIEFW